MRGSLPTLLFVAVLAGAVLAAADLRRAESHTLVLYTTPALRDFLERDVIPRFVNATGERVEPVYVAAGEQYNRLRLSGASPEADLFLHASPLFLEKGFDEGYFDPILVPEAEGHDARFRSRPVDGGRIWYAFAWSPLVEVYPPSLAAAPDLASEASFGLAHPMLSNSGVYNVLFFETLDPEAGANATLRTKVQPVHARATIAGVADGSYDVTLGYEAVTLLYQSRGAEVATALPRLHGEEHLLPVLFSVGIVKNHHHRDAERFVRFLFTNETQAGMGKAFLRPVTPDAPVPPGGLDVAGLDPLTFDWSRWKDLEARLPDYEVKT